MTKKNKSPQDGFLNKANVSADDYNKVVDVAEIASVSMVNLKFEVKPSFFSNKKRNLQYDGDVLRIDYDKENGHAIVLLDFTVQSKTGKTKTLLCKAEYIVAYRGIKDCKADAVETFLNRVGVFAAYPYFRSLFASLDWAANTSMPILPVMRQKSPTVIE